MTRAIDVPDEALAALDVLQRCFGDALLAVYLHGSAVAGGLRPSSDIDVMAVVAGPTTPELRQGLVGDVMRVSGRYPRQSGQPRPLELVVFQRGDLQPVPYPARCEFLYGEWLHAECDAGMVPAPANNPDFTLLLAQARWQAQLLFGPPAANLLPVIADADIRRAIGHALPTLRDNLQGDERNVLLTLARMWCTLATREFVPKDFAADWAIPRLPAESRAPLGLSRDAYIGTTVDDWSGREPEAQRLADELSRQITALI